VSRGALLALGEIGPGGRPEMAEALAAVLVRENSHLAAEALAKLEPSDKAAVVPLTAALEKTLPTDHWHVRVVLARALTRYGQDAAPAAPQLIAALKNVRRITAPRDAYAEEVQAYAAALAAIGPETPGAAQTVVERLDPEGPLLQLSGKHAHEAQAPLLHALGALGLPAEDPLRSAAVARLSAALASERADVFAAAAGAVGRLDRRALGDDAAPLARQLALVLKLGFEFRGEGDSDGRDANAATLTAIQALGQLGPAAREALPELKKLAQKTLVPGGSFTPEPAENAWIRAAREAVAKIEANQIGDG
jgi:hypothetical protein